jgi:hypothetical protein
MSVLETPQVWRLDKNETARFENAEDLSQGPEGLPQVLKGSYQTRDADAIRWKIRVLCLSPEHSIGAEAPSSRLNRKRIWVHPIGFVPSGGGERRKATVSTPYVQPRPGKHQTPNQLDVALVPSLVAGSLAEIVEIAQMGEARVPARGMEDLVVKLGKRRFRRLRIHVGQAAPRAIHNGISRDPMPRPKYPRVAHGAGDLLQGGWILWT